MEERAHALVREAEEVGFPPVSAGTSVEMQVLVGQGEGAPHFALRRFRIATGGGDDLVHLVGYGQAPRRSPMSARTAKRMIENLPGLPT